jgi:hypothetical protein
VLFSQRPYRELPGACVMTVRSVGIFSCLIKTSPLLLSPLLSCTRLRILSTTRPIQFLKSSPHNQWQPVNPRSYFFDLTRSSRFFKGLQFENNSDIGVFAKLTNSYCLAAIQGSTNFYSAFESELGDIVPIVHTSIGGTRIVGRLTAGTPTSCTNSVASYLC